VGQTFECKYANDEFVYSIVLLIGFCFILHGYLEKKTFQYEQTFEGLLRKRLKKSFRPPPPERSGKGTILSVRKEWAGGSQIK